MSTKIFNGWRLPRQLSLGRAPVSDSAGTARAWGRATADVCRARDLRRIDSRFANIEYPIFHKS